MDKNKNKSIFKKNIILLNKARTLATFSREMNCTKILVSI